MTLGEQTRQLKLTQDAYEMCLKNALRRMGIALNRANRLCPGTWLDKEDSAIRRRLAQKFKRIAVQETYDKLLINSRYERGDQDVDDRDEAEYFFFGRFCFRPLSTPKRIRVEYTTTRAFLTMSRRGLRWPNYSNKEIGFDQRLHDPLEFLATCGANYALKNFWHNYVHNALQHISYETYHKFEGDARNEADFEADNLANLFLIHSYGLPVKAAGSLPKETRTRIIQLLRRNRCNDVFRLRAEARGENRLSPKSAKDWREIEWLYRRALSTFISGWMAVNARAVTSIGVYFSGEIKREGGHFYRDGKAIVQLNGVRVATDVRPILSPNEDRRAHFKDIAYKVASGYENAFNDVDRGLKEYSTHSLLALFDRAGLELPHEEEGSVGRFVQRPDDVREVLIQTVSD